MSRSRTCAICGYILEPGEDYVYVAPDERAHAACDDDFDYDAEYGDPDIIHDTKDEA